MSIEIMSQIIEAVIYCTFYAIPILGIAFILITLIKGKNAHERMLAVLCGIGIMIIGYVYWFIITIFLGIFNGLINF